MPGGFGSTPDFTKFSAGLNNIKMKKLISLAVLSAIVSLVVAQELKSPEEFLGYQLGERFTRHYRVVDYFKHVASVMTNIKVEQYGETNEHRPLIVAYVTSQKNFDRLEEIRQNNLRRAGLESGTVSDEEIAIVWLSYNVHGNESSSTEATMLTLYELANPSNQKTQKWLENTVVILDPCINPDGRDRYANFYSQYGNKIPNPNLDSKEHHEPWPGGRANHYLFDLNRDWAWVSQVESKQRIALYNTWMPHVHVDFHEQFINNPYYFPPAAQPYHNIITPWQSEFQTLIGKNHAKYFDENGWIYFTKEIFDLFYPSYGDTYPTFNGAIGMTYEKGGGGLAGLAGKMENDDTVKLIDRIMHHHTTGLSTVEVSSVNADRLVKEFGAYFSRAKNNPAAMYKAFIIKGTNNPDKIKMLTNWMDTHKVQYGIGSSGNKRLTGYSYRTNNTVPVTLSPNDIVVSAYQPKSDFLNVLFEPKSKLLDSLTYDITSWSIPYIYDLDAYAVTEKIAVSPRSNQLVSFTPLEGDSKAYAYIGKYESLQDLKWFAWLLKMGVKIRVAYKDFAIDGNTYASGTIVVLRWDNKHLKKFDKYMAEASRKFRRSTKKVYSGYVSSGNDFGSRYYKLVEAPEVAVLTGRQVRSLDFGEVWHYFENDINYPVTIIDTDYFDRIDLDKYDVLIVPGGFYKIFNENTRKELTEWVRSGGRLVLISSALRSFVDTEQFSLKKYLSEEEESEAEEIQEKRDEEQMLNPYKDELRTRISDRLPGAIYQVKLDNSHPLAFGYRDSYYTLKLNSYRYAYLENGRNIGIIESSSSLVSGFVGANVKDTIGETLVFGVENMGSGSVVYMVDNPLFRAFWYNGKLIFGNAVFIR